MDKYLPSNPYTKKELTEKQVALLDSLESCNYDPLKAAEKAGYANPYSAVKALRNELVSIAEELIGNQSLQAISKLGTILNSERPNPNARLQLEAAKTILDRSGFAKKEILDVNHKVTGGVFILPEKEPIQGDFKDITHD